MDSCKKNPYEVVTNQTRISLQPTRVGVKEEIIVSWRFEQDKSREAMCYWLIVDGLPFKIIEDPGFKRFMSVGCPMFVIPTKRTIIKDIYNLYVNEKAKLKSFIKNQTQSVCITTDTWTSIQDVNYMCMTVHFIDDNWNLQKRILNFCPILGDKRKEVGRGIEKCLFDWGIDKVFTITMDNASSDDGAVVYLQKKFDDWGTSLLGGKYTHMRCITYIINLVVEDGLRDKQEHECINRIRGAIRYIRNSPSRYKKFQECVEIEKLETKELLSLDVPTRWDSTYLMLKSAICLRRAFDTFMDIDLAYTKDLSKEPYDGIPTNDDWDRVELLCKFLAHFHKVTLCVSDSLYVTANMVFHEIISVYMLLRQWSESETPSLKAMSTRMKAKFVEYWGAIEKMNLLLYIAVILDPRYKMDFLDFAFDTMYDNIRKSGVMKETVIHGMQELFDTYKVKYGNPTSPSSSSSSTVISLDSFNSRYYLMEMYKRKKIEENSNPVRSELKKYLGEEPVDDEDNFDILTWWTVNAPRFPILSKIARDVMAVPASTVAPNAAFSTSGRILDTFRSSLSPRILQALVCTQDWLRPNSMPINVEEDLSEIETISKELLKMGVDFTIVDV